MAGPGGMPASPHIPKRSLTELPAQQLRQKRARTIPVAIVLETEEPLKARSKLALSPRMRAFQRAQLLEVPVRRKSRLALTEKQRASERERFKET